MFRVFLLTTRRNFCNIPLTLSLLAGVLIMSGILGNAIKGMQENGITFNESVAYINELDENYGPMLDQLILDPVLKDVFQVTKVKTEEEAMKGVEDGFYRTLVSAKEVDGKQEILIYTVNQQTPVKSIIISFVETANYALKAYKQGRSWQVTDESSESLFNKVQTEKGVPMGVDYYAIVTLLQTLVFGGLVGVYAVLEDYEKNTILRLKSAPISANCIFFARILANTVYLTSICLIIAAFTSVLYGANWKGNWVIIIVIIVLFSAVVNGLGMISAAITRSSGLSIGIVVLALMLWSKDSGAFGPNPPHNIFTNLSPNFHAKNAIFAAIYGGSNQLLFQSLLGLVIIGSSIYGLFFLINRRKINGYL